MNNREKRTNISNSDNFIELQISVVSRVRNPWEYSQIFENTCELSSTNFYNRTIIL